MHLHSRHRCSCSTGTRYPRTSRIRTQVGLQSPIRRKSTSGLQVQPLQPPPPPRPHPGPLLWMSQPPPSRHWGDAGLGSPPARPRPPLAFPAAGGTGGGSGSKARVRELGQQPTPTDRAHPSAVRVADPRCPRSKALQEKGVSQKTRLLCTELTETRDHSW